MFYIHRYKSNAERVAKLFRDRPLSVLDTAIYWIEYVIKYNGAPHLRTVGADLPWYQYFLIDVAAILLSILVLVLTIVYYLINYTLKLLFRHKTSIKAKNE